MQPGSLGTQDSEAWIRAAGLSVLKLETPRAGKEREDVLCSSNATYIAILTPRIISRSQAASRSDMETWAFILGSSQRLRFLYSYTESSVRKAGALFSLHCSIRV